MSPYLPITCPECKARLAEFHRQTGYLRESEGSSQKVYGIVFTCGCGRMLRFDGSRAVKKLKKTATIIVIANRP